MLSPEVVRSLEAHDWPGNVRELANVMEHACILSSGGRVGSEHLPHLVRRGGNGAASMASAPSGPMTLEDMETKLLMESLERHNGNKTAAAAELGISLKTIYNKLDKLADRRAAA